MNKYLISLDIGTSKVRVIVAEVADESAHIVGVGSAVSRGMKKGAIIDIDEAVQSIREAVEDAERMVGIEITGVYVGISGNHISLQPSHGVVAVSSEDREIGSQDVERVLQAARVVALPPERIVVEVVPKQFVVDGLTGIRDPHGMIGVRLEVEGLIVTGSRTIVHNVLRCVEKASLSVLGIVLLPLATSEISLSLDEKNLGVVLVDIGGGTTTLTIFQQGNLEATVDLPIGGEYITNDIAIGLRTQTEVARKLKEKYGVALAEEASRELTFPVPTIGTRRERMVSQLELAHIIEPRVAEIFQLMRKQVVKLGYSPEPAGGFVLTGGVLSIPHISRVAMNELGQAVRVAIPEANGVQDPSYTGSVGMIYYLHRRRLAHFSEHGTETVRHKSKQGPTPFERMKNWLSELI